MQDLLPALQQSQALSPQKQPGTLRLANIGKMPVSEMGSVDVLEFLTPIWHVKAVTARCAHHRMRAVLEWAVAMEFRIDNPCDRVVPVLGAQHDVDGV